MNSPKLFHCLTIILLNGYDLAYTQSFQIIVDKSFGGTSGDGMSDILQSGNCLYLIGNSRSDSSGNRTIPLCNPSAPILNDIDLWMLKLDTAMNIIWQTGIRGNKFDLNGSISFNNDSSIIYFGSKSESDSSCEKSENNRTYPNVAYDYWLGAIDLNGTLLWEKTLGGNDIEGECQVYALSTGELMFIGNSLSPISGDKSVNNYGGIWSDVWLIKADSLGNKIWDRVYGGSGSDSNANRGINGLSLPNGEFIFTCFSTSPQDGTISEPNRGGGDIWIAKIDSSGNILWDKRYGGNGGDACTKMIKFSDGGFILCGLTSSDQGFEVSDTSFGYSDIWLLKIDSIGNKIWDKRFGGLNFDFAFDVVLDFDGGFLLGGQTSSDSGFSVSEPPYGAVDYWVVKTDSMGNKLWDRRFGGLGGSNFFSSLTLLADSSILLAGTSNALISPVKTDPGYGDQDGWLIRFKYQDTTVSISEFLNSDVLVTLFPNPSTGIINIPDELLNSELLISDVTGRLVFGQKDIQSSKLHFESLPTGCYFLEFRNNQVSYFGKWLKI